jgi:IclR family pca regulon transcriptional regulator
MPSSALPRPAANPKNQVQSVAKAFAVLRAFGPGLPALTVAEAALRAELDRGTAFRLINTLLDLGYLRPAADGRRFRLGLKCLDLGYSALSGHELAEHATPLLQELVPWLADAGSMGALEAGEVIYLARVEAGLNRNGPLRRRGARVGAYATALGQAILAWLPRDQQVAQLEAVPRVKLSERTLVGLEELLARLEAVRARGYALADGENAYGLCTVAAPVLDEDGAPLAGVSLTIRGGQLPAAEFATRAAPHALAVAKELAEAVRLSHGTIGVRR